MKIAIATIYDNNNFGNRLQNYAVQTYFQNMGACVTTVIDAMQAKPAKIYFDPVKILKRIAHFVLQHLGFEKDKVKKKALIEKRWLYIKGFSDEYLATTSPINYRQRPRRNLCKSE